MCTKVAIRLNDSLLLAGDVIPGDLLWKNLKIHGNIIDGAPESSMKVTIDDAKARLSINGNVQDVATWEFGELTVRVDRASSRFSV
jgi:hypothetical protein